MDSCGHSCLVIVVLHLLIQYPRLLPYLRIHRRKNPHQCHPVGLITRQWDCILGLDCEAGSEEEKTILFLYDLFNPTNVVLTSGMSYLLPLPGSFPKKEFLGTQTVPPAVKTTLYSLFIEQIQDGSLPGVLSLYFPTFSRLEKNANPLTTRIVELEDGEQVPIILNGAALFLMETTSLTNVFVSVIQSSINSRRSGFSTSP